ncbi:MAG: hypothetical protein ACI8W7_001296 [Gammaproteobacteria bacterium]|jgi:hypothetical protein
MRGFDTRPRRCAEARIDVPRTVDADAHWPPTDAETPAGCASHQARVFARRNPTPALLIDRYGKVRTRKCHAADVRPHDLSTDLARVSSIAHYSTGAGCDTPRQGRDGQRFRAGVDGPVLVRIDPFALGCGDVRTTTRFARGIARNARGLCLSVDYGRRAWRGRSTNGRVRRFRKRCSGLASRTRSTCAGRPGTCVATTSEHCRDQGRIGSGRESRWL